MITLSLSSSITYSSALYNVMFVSPTSNVKTVITEPKTESVSKVKNDKGKFILGAPPKVVKETKQNNHHSLIRSLNQRNLISIIIVEHRDTLVQIAISGLPLNKVIMCYLSEAKINFKILWLLLGNS